jgi:hypothetical protein
MRNALRLNATSHIHTTDDNAEDVIAGIVMTRGPAWPGKDEPWILIPDP